MERSREARRAASMAAPTNGLSSSSSRRRHRSGSLRDSPDEDGGVDLQESGRLRERGVMKKDRDRDRDRGDRERERERDRERSSRSKRRRENRMMVHHTTTGSNRDDGDDTSEESVNDEDEDDDDDGGSGGGGLRMLPPPANQSTAAMPPTHHNHNHNQLHHRKSFPPNATKVFRATAPPPAWKAADEMIGVSVPRKARSASTKRSHDWISSGGGGVGGVVEPIQRQSSTSPVRLASSAASPVPAAPLSPSSPNVSIRKKMKANGGSSKPKPPKSYSKSSSSNPEELEIEIAEVLYGLMTQSQAPSKKEIPSTDSATKFDSNKSSSDNKSRVSSPVSNSTAAPQNSASVAPKRKRPRQVSENPFGARSSPVSSSVKTEVENNNNQSPKTEVSSPNLENNNSGSAADTAAAAAQNGVSFGFTSLPNHLQSAASVSSLEPPPAEVEEEEKGKCGDGDVVLNKEVKKESAAAAAAAARVDDENGGTERMIATAASTTANNLSKAVAEIESQREEKFEIDLMAPPPQQRSSPDRDGDVDFTDCKLMPSGEMSKVMNDKEDERLKKMDLVEEQSKLKAGALQETDVSLKKTAMNDLQLDLEKPDKQSSGVASGSSSRSQHHRQPLKHQQPSLKPTRDETHVEKSSHPNSLPLPLSMASWPPMGYVAPLQGVVSMDGSAMSSAPMQPIFTQPRPKRCATHCYIARNIHYLQQFMKINNPFWPAAAAGPAPIFGAKACNLNVMPSTELHANRTLKPVQEKGQGITIFPGHAAATAVKDNKSSQATNNTDPSQRKQQILLQQALPPVTPNNILHGPAFIFPFNQQQAVAASASVRPGSSKPATTSTGGSAAAAASTAENSATVNAPTSGATALSFNYSNIATNETQYLAILQNNAYPFPIPAVGAPPNYRGSPHAQAMPLFNGSFYSSQMIHPSHIQQQQQQQAPPAQPQHPTSQAQQISQANQNSSGSNSSQKQLQMQRQQGGNATGVSGGAIGNMPNSFPAQKNRSSQPASQQQGSHYISQPPPQARHLEHEVAGGEDSPSTADSRGSRGPPAMSVYGHNFAMPVHHQNFALMNPQAALSNAASGNSNDKKQQHQQQQSQQQGSKRGMESSLPQTFAMSFAPFNGTGGATSIDLSSMAQNHAIIQGFPESLRQSYHQMMAAPAVAAAAHNAQQKKNFRISEETTKTGGHDSSNVEEERKGGGGLTGKSGQSIAFSRSEFGTDASTSSATIPSVIDSSSRNINLASSNRSSRSPMSSSAGTNQSPHHLHAHQLQQQQQQMLQLHKQQQQNQHIAASMNARTKNPPTSNGSAYPEHLITTSSMAAKFPNSLSSFSQNIVQSSNPGSSPAQSPQWKNSVRGPTTSQVPSSLASSNTSSLKNIHQPQQQASRVHQQSHTQISFGASNQKLSSTSSSQGQPQNPSNSNQCPSPPMVVGSPTTSSISKGGVSGSPRTNASASTSGKTAQASSLSSSQQPKNSPVPTQRSSASILGSPHMTNNQNTSKTQLQQQQQQQQQPLSKHTLQQAQLYYANPYMQVPQAQAQAQAQQQQHSGSSTTASGTTSGYYNLSRKQQNQPPSSTGMLSLCPPVTLASTTTSDPTKAIQQATAAAGNMKGGAMLASQHGILHAAQFAASQSSNAAGHQLLPTGFPQYVHAAPAAVQVKPAEQKQPAA